MNSSDSTTLPAADQPKPPAPDAGPVLGAGIDFTDPRSPLAPFYFQISHVVAAVLLVLVGLLFAVFPLWHTDIWAHMKFGAWIVAHSQLPPHEPFGPFADVEAPYIHFQWLSQVGFYLVYHLGELVHDGDPVQRLAGGAEALRIAHSALALLRCLFLLLAFQRVARSLPWACVGLVLLLGLSHAYLAVLRPQVVGEVFFAVLLWALSRPVPSARALIGVPLLLAVWTNTHGSFVIGLVLLAGFLLGRILEAGTGANGWSIRAAGRDAGVRRLALLFVLSIAACGLLNPHGPELFVWTVRLARNPNVAGLVEWQPLGRSWTLAAALALLVVTFGVSPRPVSATSLLLLLGFGLLACLQQRMLVWWLTLVPWALLPHWQALGAAPGWDRLRVRSVPSFRKTLLAGALVFILAAGLRWMAPAARLGQPRPPDRALHGGTPWALALQLENPNDPHRLPALTAALQRVYPEGRFTGGIFASETLGDYLFWALAPDIPVFIYTHVHLFTPAHWQDTLTVKFAQPGWQEVLARNNINLVVIEAELYPQLRQRIAANPAWVVVQDETGAAAKPDARSRLFIALRKQPLPRERP